MKNTTQDCKCIRACKICDDIKQHYHDGLSGEKRHCQPQVVNKSDEVVNKVVKSQTSEGSWIKEFKKISDIFYGFHEVVDDHTKKECDCFPLLVSKLERFTSDLLARERRDVVGERKSVEELQDVIPEAFKDLASKVAFKEGYHQKVKELDDLTREESK